MADTARAFVIARFDMEVMEDCIGGKHKGLAYNKVEYQKWCEQYDKEADEELAKAEASMSVRDVAPGLV